ncbi:WW/Rsp5/WWP [Gossypium australe]|uniref:WW/Rsp5/WWP n=1 Tax=Gossypium australe TaxID=47621 RepID=A0A5B6VIS5_9ROSI|nr:WW/Rsp5/WWP [Gossypium australe]
MAQFNIALLAKQGWRLLNYPNSLVAQVFKAKYFPTGDFLNSRLGNTCSYVWRNIWSTKATLEKELIKSHDREWDRDLIVNSFQAEIAKLIFRILRRWNHMKIFEYGLVNRLVSFQFGALINYYKELILQLMLYRTSTKNFTENSGG